VKNGENAQKMTETMIKTAWGAAVAQRLRGENEKINEIERTPVRSPPPRATSFLNDKTAFLKLSDQNFHK
jgi:hypothetical protein